MTDRRHRFDDRLVHRDLEEVLGGDAPSSKARARLLAAVKAKAAQRGDNGRLATRPTTARRSRQVVKRSNPWIGVISSVAALVVVALVAYVMLNRGDEPERHDTAVIDNVGNAQIEVPEPDPLVDTPEPQPTPEPEPRRVVVATVIGRSPDAEVRLPGSRTFEPLLDDELVDGAFLRSSSPIDLQMPGGARVRIAGSALLTEAFVDPRGEIYVDSVGCETAVTLRVGYASIVVDQAEAWLGSVDSWPTFFCYVGEIRAEAEDVDNQVMTLGAGKRARFFKAWFVDPEPLADADRTPALLNNLPPREIVRFAFDDEPGGVARAEGDNGVVWGRVPDDRRVTVLPDSVMRLRFRATGNEQVAIYLQILGPQAGEQWGRWTRLDAATRSGEWVQWDVPMTDFSDDANEADGPPPAHGQAIASFKVFIQHDPAATLEVDWLELVRIR